MSKEKEYEENELMSEENEFYSQENEFLYEENFKEEYVPEEYIVNSEDVADAEDYEDGEKENDKRETKETTKEEIPEVPFDDYAENNVMKEDEREIEEKEKKKEKEVKEKKEKEKKLPKRSKRPGFGSKIADFMTRQRGQASLFEIITEFIASIPRAISTLLYRITHGKNWREDLARERALNEAIKNNKERMKEEKEKDETKEKGSLNKTLERLGVIKKEAIQGCLDNFKGKDLREIFENEKDLELFAKYLDNYLDVTFLKEDTKEFDLVAENNKIYIYKMDREDGKNRELVYGMDVNEVYETYNSDNSGIEKEIYTAMMELCKTGEINIYPKLDEIGLTFKERIEAMPPGKEEEIVIRNKEFTISKNDNNEITLSHQVLNEKTGEYEKKNILENLVTNDENMLRLTKCARYQIYNSMNNELLQFERKKEREEDIKLHQDKSIKESMDEVIKRHEFDGYDINFKEEVVTFIVKEGDEFTKPIVVDYAFDGYLLGVNGKNALEISKYLSDEQVDRLNREMEVLVDKIYDYDIEDIFENHEITEEKEYFTKEEQTYTIERKGMTAEYDIWKDDTYLYTYNSETKESCVYSNVKREKEEELEKECVREGREEER